MKYESIGFWNFNLGLEVKKSAVVNCIRCAAQVGTVAHGADVGRSHIKAPDSCTNAGHVGIKRP